MAHLSKKVRVSDYQKAKDEATNKKAKMLIASNIAKDKVSLELCKDYCKEQGWETDYENIILPIFKKYGWKGLSVGVSWSDAFIIDCIDLDLLSTMVYYNDDLKQFIAY